MDRSNDVAPRKKKGDSELKLSVDHHIQVGEFAHKLQRGVREYYRSRSTNILAGLNVSGVTEAKELFSVLGRRGREPWLAPRYREKLPYINPQTLVVIPVAHLCLRGLLKSFIGLSVGKVKGWKLKRADQGGSPLMLSLEAVDAVKVSHIQLRRWATGIGTMYQVPITVYGILYIRRGSTVLTRAIL